MAETALDNATLVNTGTAGQQYDAAVAALTGGGYVVIWDDNQRQEVYGQRYDAAGNKVGAEFQVNTTTTGTQFFPTVGALSDGGFVVAWQSGTLSAADIYARRYDAAGTPAGNDFLVNSGATANEQLNARVIGLSGGGFVISWDTIATGYFQDVSAQVYDAAGSTAGSAITLNTTTSDQQGISSLAPLGTGFVATWQSITPAGGNNAEIFGQRFDSSGIKLGSEFQVNTTIPQSQYGNDVAVLGNSDIVVSWTDPATNTIFARRFNGIGTALTGELTIAAVTAPSIGGTTLTALNNNGFLVSWIEGDGTKNQIFARAYSSANVALTDKFMVSQNTTDFPVQTPDGVALLTSGNVVFAWDGPTSNTDQDIYFRRFSVPSSTTFTGDSGNNTFSGTTADDLFLLQQGGNDTASGGPGNDGFIFGPTLTAADVVDGGAGTNDQVGIQGNYSGGLTLGASNLTNVEVLVLLPGNDTRFGDLSGAFYSYNLTTVAANVNAGQLFVVNWNTLRSGENVTFNGSAETNGSFLTYGGAGNDNITGGQQLDGFYFGGGKFGANDVLNGQGGNDQLGLQGDYSGANAITFGAGQLTSIETLVLLSGADTRFGGGGLQFNYTITMNDANLAAGATMIINANTLRSNEVLTFDGGAESSGNFTLYLGAGDDNIIGGAGNDKIYASGGYDIMRGGAGNDTFVYLSTAVSNGAGADLIADFTNNLTGDLIDLSAIDANTTVGGDQAFTWIGTAAFSNSPGQLRYFAVGPGPGGSSLVYFYGDTNGDGVADLEIHADVFGPGVGAYDFIL